MIARSFVTWGPRPSSIRTPTRTRSWSGSAAKCPGQGPPRPERMLARPMDPGSNWPPVYDEVYLPDPQERYWDSRRETMDPPERDATVLRRLQAVTRWAWDHSGFYREK